MDLEKCVISLKVKVEVLESRLDAIKASLDKKDSKSWAIIILIVATAINLLRDVAGIGK